MAVEQSFGPVKTGTFPLAVEQMDQGIQGGNAGGWHVKMGQEEFLEIGPVTGPGLP